MSIIVPTGRIVKEYLDEYEISIETFIAHSQISQDKWALFYSGDIRITDEILDSLDVLIPFILRDYWINLDEKYHDSIEDKMMNINIDSKELSKIAKRFKFKEVFDGLGYSILRQAVEMLKILDLKSFDEFNERFSNLSIDFMEDGGESEAIVVWLKLCEEEVDIQNSDISSVEYSADKLKRNLDKFKKLALMNDNKGFKVNCRRLCNRLGINLVICDALSNSKVRGALTTVDNKPTIYISGRFKTHDHVWFAFIHEIGHLIYHYDSERSIVSMEDELEKEDEASKFAQCFFINPDEYKIFIDKGAYKTKAGIIAFAGSQRVQPGIVVGRLQHDKYISMNSMNDLKIKIEFD